MHPDRRDEVIVEVLRGGVVVATVYGSREGIHIVSALFEGGKRARPFFLHKDPRSMAGIVVPLLQSCEECPWCNGRKVFEEGPCPVCR